MYSLTFRFREAIDVQLFSTFKHPNDISQYPKNHKGKKNLVYQQFLILINSNSLIYSDVVNANDIFDESQGKWLVSASCCLMKESCASELIFWMLWWESPWRRNHLMLCWICWLFNSTMVALNMDLLLLHLLHRLHWMWIARSLDNPVIEGNIPCVLVYVFVI